MHSLSAWGLPTPVVALACIDNVDIQVFSGVGGRLYFIRRLQVCNIASPERGGGPAKLMEGFFHRYSSQPISQRSKKRKELAYPCTYGNASHEDYTSTKIPRRGEQAAAAAVTLPFSQLKLGRKVSGDPPPAVTLPFLQLKLGRKESPAQEICSLPCRAFVFSAGLCQRILL